MRRRKRKARDGVVGCDLELRMAGTNVTGSIRWMGAEPRRKGADEIYGFAPGESPERRINRDKEDGAQRKDGLGDRDGRVGCRL